MGGISRGKVWGAGAYSPNGGAEFSYCFQCLWKLQLKARAQARKHISFVIGSGGDPSLPRAIFFSP